MTTKGADWWQVIVASLGTGIGGTLIGALIKRPADKADMASKLTDSAMGMVDQLQEEVAILREQVSNCEERHANLRRELFALKSYLADLGIVVPDQPTTP